MKPSAFVVHYCCHIEPFAFALPASAVPQPTSGSGTRVRLEHVGTTRVSCGAPHFCSPVGDMCVRLRPRDTDRSGAIQRNLSDRRQLVASTNDRPRCVRSIATASTCGSAPS
jgi:hypothetical protein